MKTHQWKRVKWPFNHEEPYASWECWQYRQIILHPSQMGGGATWDYVASFGKDSERSHSGGFPDGITLEAAKAKVEQRYAVNGW
jgi:hypothetical protein